MAREQGIIRLPFKLTEFNEDMIPLLSRNFAEIERLLSQLQMYEKKIGKPINETVNNIVNDEGKVSTDKLSDIMVGLEHTLQLADEAVTSTKVALGAITESLLGDGSVTDLKLAAGAVTEAKTNWQTHLLSDYAVVNNAPTVGYVTWANVKIVYKGREYEVEDGNSNKTYLWWDFDYPTTMQQADTLPSMTDDDVLIFLNKNGICLVVPKASVVDGGLIVSESILTDALAANAVTANKIAAGAIETGKLAANSVVAENIVTGAVTAAKINVDNLAAISADLGTINTGHIQVGETIKDIADMETETGAGAKINALTEYIDGIGDDLEAQIDGKIDVWFYSETPTLNNIPAKDWDTNEKRDRHIDDLYFNLSTGYSYRFKKEESIYSWERVKDSDITSAMSAASVAQDTADGKRRIFVVQPTPPYDAGDLWAPGSGGEMKKCKVAKLEGQNYSASDWESASNSVQTGVAYNNVKITPADGIIVENIDGSNTQVNGTGIDVRGGNIKIYDDDGTLVMDGRGVNPLEVSGWGITSGLTFHVSKMTPTSNYIEVKSTSPIVGQPVPFTISLNDVSRLGSSGTLRAYGDYTVPSSYKYDSVNSANKTVRVTEVLGGWGSRPAGTVLMAMVVNGVSQPTPQADINITVTKGNAILPNGTYIKVPSNVIINTSISTSFEDFDGWAYKVLFLNGDGQIVTLNTGTAGLILNPWEVNSYPAHPRYNNIGTGTPDPNCIVLGAILYGYNMYNSFGAHEIMHPDFRDERALKVNNLVQTLPSYYGDIEAIEKSVLTTSTVSTGYWKKEALSLGNGQKYKIALPVGQGKRIAIVSFSMDEGIVPGPDDNPRSGAVVLAGLRDPYVNAWQPAVSVGYNNYFIDSYFEDAYGRYIVHESSMGWSYRRITRVHLEIGIDGEMYLHIELYQYSGSETRSLRVGWFAF